MWCFSSFPDNIQMAITHIQPCIYTGSAASLFGVVMVCVGEYEIYKHPMSTKFKKSREQQKYHIAIWVHRAKNRSQRI